MAQGASDDLAAALVAADRGDPADAVRLGGGHGRIRRAGARRLVGLGVAGGLVPSPTALVVQLGAIGLSRIWFEVGLVLSYGLGMAATLTAAVRWWAACERRAPPTLDAMDRWAIEIDRDDITRAWTTTDPAPALPPGAVEVAVSLIALTANNITYATLGGPSGLLGDDAGYWDFFAARDAPGRLPVWGFATVTSSDNAGLPVGEQLYGYWPLADHASLAPERIGPTGFVDGTPRRRPLPALYNRYQRLGGLDDYDPADHPYWPIFRPLHLTGWLIADQLADVGGTEQILVTAASSRTALALAHSVRQRNERPELVGLTSPANVALLERVGYYDRTLTYDAVASVPRRASALVDVAGNPAVVRAVHERLGDVLQVSLVVGKAHWDADGDGGPLPGPRRTGFFAPARMEKRSADWGAAGLRDRIGAGWREFMRDARDLTRLDERHGADAALAAYQDLVHGRADPAVSVLVRP